MSKKEKLAFDKENYRWMLIGIVVLIIGFFIMSLDKEDYGFGKLGIVVGPIVVMIGYIIEFFAIFRKSKK
jgi:ATP/ADP translocase